MDYYLNSSLFVFLMVMASLPCEANSVSELRTLKGVENATLDESLNIGDASMNSSTRHASDMYTIVPIQKSTSMNSTSNSHQDSNFDTASRHVTELKSTSMNTTSHPHHQGNVDTASRHVTEFKSTSMNTTSHPHHHGNVDTKSRLLAELKSIWKVEGLLAEAKALLLTSSTEAIFEVTSQRLPVGISQSSRICSRDIRSVVVAAKQKVQWALEMIDATGKPGSGFIPGNAHFYGDFDECMRIDTDQHFDSQYCLVRFGFTKFEFKTVGIPALFIMGLCIPSSCGVDEIELVTNQYLALHQPDIFAGVYKSKCHERKPSLTRAAKVIICICSILTAVLVTATVYDVALQNKWFQPQKEESHDLCNGKDGNINGQKKPSKMEICKDVLMPFSVYTNLLDLFDTRPGRGTIDCIHGIKFFSMTWVVLFHLITVPIGHWDNPYGYTDKELNRWTFAAVFQATLSVDTFFTITGLLSTYLTLKKFSKKKVTIWYIGNSYIQRYLRLTPVYLFIMLAFGELIRYVYNGPDWVASQSCSDSWWQQLLYINNFTKILNCMPWAWYLANDMQFYIVAPLIYVPLVLYGLKGLVVPCVFLIGSAICSGVIIDYYDLGIHMVVNHRLSLQTYDYWIDYFMKPYTRIGPYIVGMMTGFVLYKYGREVKLPLWSVVFGWLAATGVALTIVYGISDYMDGPVSSSLAAWYSALHRIGWSMCVAWVIYACANGYGGSINSFLSWRAFAPLSRLNYCFYLIHFYFIRMFYGSQRRPYHQNNFTMLYLFPGILIVVYTFSLIPYLAIEIPIARLVKVIGSHINRISKKG